MPPLKKRQKQLKEARMARTELLRAMQLSLASQADEEKRKEQQQDDEEAMFDENTQEWEEVLASEDEAGTLNGCGDGEDEGEDVWAQISADTQALWNDHVAKSREIVMAEATSTKRPYIRTSRRTKFREQKARNEIVAKGQQKTISSFFKPDDPMDPISDNSDNSDGYTSSESEDGWNDHIDVDGEGMERPLATPKLMEKQEVLTTIEQYLAAKDKDISAEERYKLIAISSYFRLSIQYGMRKGEAIRMVATMYKRTHYWGRCLIWWAEE
ncbi:hypothetical protein BGZ75_002017, partial [Mortierella antarctica]